MTKVVASILIALLGIGWLMTGDELPRAVAQKKKKLPAGVTKIGDSLNHTDEVNSVVFSPNGKMLATGSDNGTARVWDAATGKSVGEPFQHADLGQPVGQRDWVMIAAFSPDNKTLVTGGGFQAKKAKVGRGQVKFWNIATGKQVGPELTHAGGQVIDLSYSRDGKSLLTACWDMSGRLWRDGSVIHTFSHERGTEAPDITETRGMWCCALSPDGKTALTGCTDGTVRFWNIVTGQPTGIRLDHSLPVFCMALSSDGKTLATGCSTPFFRKPPVGQVTLWNAATGKKLHVIERESRVWSVAFSPDDKLLLSGEESGQMRLWDTASAKQILEPWFFGGVRTVAFSSDGTTVAAGSTNKTAQLWKIKLP